MSTPLDSSPASEAIGGDIGDHASVRPIRSVRPMYLKVLAAAVAMMILGSPTLVRLAGMIDRNAFWWMQGASSGVAVALILATLAITPVAAIRLRSQGRDISRSYGVAAIIGAATGVGFTFPSVVWSMVMMNHMSVGLSRFWPYHLDDASRNSVDHSTIAITVAWLILALTGAGRRPSNGFERLGVGFGLLWILTYVAGYGLRIAPWLF